MKVDVDVLVVGGGFKSVAAAWGYAKQGLSVALTEAGPKIGGFMSPIRWDEHWIDKGPQFFDNFEPQDVALMEEMIGPDVMEEVGFEYGSYLGGRLNEDFAIPDWQALGEDVALEIFEGLFEDRIRRRGKVPDFGSLDDVLSFDGGAVLHDRMRALTRKFLRRDAQEVSPRATNMITFVGRKKLFDQDLSMDLKRSPMLDGMLAARKVAVGEARSNLYPKGASLEVVRVALEEALERAGVRVLTETRLEDFEPSGVARGNGTEVHFGRVFFGTDIREAEGILTGGASIAERTHILPEIFHCFVVPVESVARPYYVVDYDTDHRSSRITHFLHYMGCVDDTGHGVICVEEPVDKGDARWEDPEAGLERIFAEAGETGAVRADSYRKAKSFRVPATYKVPLVGIETRVEDFLAGVRGRFGDRVVIPDPFVLTRKEALDDLRQIGVLG